MDQNTNLTPQEIEDFKAKIFLFAIFLLFLLACALFVEQFLQLIDLSTCMIALSILVSAFIVSLAIIFSAHSIEKAIKNTFRP